MYSFGDTQTLSGHGPAAAGDLALSWEWAGGPQVLPSLSNSDLYPVFQRFSFTIRVPKYPSIQ